MFSTLHHLSVYSVLTHISSCMRSCDVSLCGGGRGAWSEVHVGQYGSAVVMTIILLKTVIGCTCGWCPVVHQSLVFRFAWQDSCYCRGLFVVITKDFIISKVFFHQSGQSPKIIRAKGVGLERTDSQTVGEFPRGRRKGRYSTLPLCFHSLTCLQL